MYTFKKMVSKFVAKLLKLYFVVLGIINPKKANYITLNGLTDRHKIQKVFAF